MEALAGAIALALGVAVGQYADWLAESTLRRRLRAHRDWITRGRPTISAMTYADLYARALETQKAAHPEG